MPWIRQGGAELIAVQTAYQLQKLNHQVRLAALFVDLSQMGKEARQIKYISCGSKMANLFKKNKLFLYFIGPFFLFWLILRQIKWADILFPQSLPSYWLAPIAGRLYRKKVIWLCNEPPKRRSVDEVDFIDWVMWLIADSFLDGFFTRKIKRVIVYSRGIAREVKRRYGKKATLIRLGIDFKFFSKENKKEAFNLKRKYHLKDRFILLMVGKLHPQKNQRFAVEILAKILPKIENAVLVLVGEGIDRKNLELRIKNLELSNKVILAGFCQPKEVRAWYAVSDLVLFPSVRQTATVDQSWGFVPFEALCQGKISLVSKESGAAEVLGREKLGIVCRLKVNDFSGAVLSVFQNSPAYQKMGKRGRRYVKEKLRWERYGQEVNQVIDEGF